MYCTSYQYDTQLLLYRAKRRPKPKTKEVPYFQCSCTMSMMTHPACWREGERSSSGALDWRGVWSHSFIHLPESPICDYQRERCR